MGAAPKRSAIWRPRSPASQPRTEPGKKADEGADWFALVAGTGEEWRKTDAVAAGLGPMFERWKGRLELGPAPSIKRDEFIKFSKLHHPTTRPPGLAPGKEGIKPNDEADKAFRVLDLNGDGELTGKEFEFRDGRGQARWAPGSPKTITASTSDGKWRRRPKN